MTANASLLPTDIDEGIKLLHSLTNLDEMIRLYANNTTTYIGSYGPSGGNGGGFFSIFSLPVRIEVIRIRSGKYIDAIQIGYAIDGRDGPPIYFNGTGGKGGGETEFVLEKGQYLTGITGKTGYYVDSLTFLTNKGPSPRFGGTGGEQSYLYSKGDEQIVGFFGRSGDYIDSIGVYTAPLPM